MRQCTNSKEKLFYNREKQTLLYSEKTPNKHSYELCMHITLSSTRGRGGVTGSTPPVPLPPPRTASPRFRRPECLRPPQRRRLPRPRKRGGESAPSSTWSQRSPEWRWRRWRSPPPLPPTNFRGMATGVACRLPCGALWW